MTNNVWKLDSSIESPLELQYEACISDTGTRAATSCSSRGPEFTRGSHQHRNEWQLPPAYLQAVEGLLILLAWGYYTSTHDPVGRWALQYTLLCDVPPFTRHGMQLLSASWSCVSALGTPRGGQRRLPVGDGGVRFHRRRASNRNNRVQQQWPIIGVEPRLVLRRDSTGYSARSAAAAHLLNTDRLSEGSMHPTQLPGASVYRLQTPVDPAGE